MRRNGLQLTHVVKIVHAHEQQPLAPVESTDWLWTILTLIQVLITGCN
jgi:hypothetical protein